MTLYRKYRPQKLSELDCESIRDRLSNILSSPYTPHAFLFSGPRGTGKTSAARIIAKILNCEKKDISNQKSDISKNKLTTENRPASPAGGQLISDIEPCNKCESCISITEGRHLDLIEIDAASNRGIDEIRELRDKIKLAPVSGKCKVYIIDEVHMLTSEAFNALLKTLEEPPSHAVFILATTEPEKLPETIVSRCIRINFQRATIEEVKHSLKRVVAGEKVDIGDDILMRIADAADGSFRDGTKLLEQALAEKAISKETISKLLGKESTTAVNFLRLLLTKDPKAVLEEILKMSGAGTNFRFLTEDILRTLHKVLIIQYQVEKDSVPADLVEKLSQKEVLYLIKLFSRVYLELKTTNLPYLPLEMAVVEWCEGRKYV